MKQKLPLIFLLAFTINVNAQISPTSSPYYQQGPFSVVTDSVTDTSPQLMIHRPSTPGNYPVFIFQLGANGFFSSAIDWHTYDLYLQHLASYGVLVIIIDDTNAGMPDGTSFNTTYSWFTDNVNNAAHWLNNYANADKVIIGGHSNGGVNACAFIDANPNEVEGIVLFASYPSPGVLGIGAHDMSNFTGKVLDMAGSEDNDSNASDCVSGYEAFIASDCKTWVLVEGMDHGGFGDYVNADQPVGSIGRDDATGTVRHYLTSWFLSEFYDDPFAASNLKTTALQPLSTQEFDNTCGIISGKSMYSKTQDFNVYPNPAYNIINIECQSSNNNVEIYNILGSLIYTATNKKAIDISSFSEGVYIIRIESNNHSFTQQFIKK